MSAPQQTQCKEVAALLVFYACEETSAQEKARIEKHLAGCAACASQLAEERSLHESLMEALQASEQFDSGGILLSQCRSELAEALDDLSAPPLKKHWQPLGWLRSWMAMRPVWSAAVLVLLGLGLGTQGLPWLSARLDSGSNGQTVNVSPSARFTDEQLAKMAVAGISFSPTSDSTAGTLQLHVKTEQPLVLSGSVDDPDLRRVLTYVVENGNQTEAGVRLDCLEALRARTGDADVRRALLYAARNDQNPAVRMKAMESLRDVVVDQTVRETLIDALEHDSNPGVRVEAVNLLVRSLEGGAAEVEQTPKAVLAPEPVERSLDPSMERVIQTLQDLERSDPNRYVRLRSAAALRQMGPHEVQ
jgi:HEAT repeats/Putative zinc-finger